MFLNAHSCMKFASCLVLVSGWVTARPGAAYDCGHPADQPTATIMATQDGDLQMSTIRLPLEILGWKQAGETQRITRDTIFNYMDGAGELYIGYRFHHIEVHEYESDQNGPILVELYFMESPDDAFGLLSLDWGGEVLDDAVGRRSDVRRSDFPVGQQTSPSQTTGAESRYPSVLFGSGLLRMRTGSLYVRILAEQDTESTRQAAIELARLITAGAEKSSAPAPALLSALPDSVEGYSIAATGKVFFRSHLVLNSVYFLATRNILELGRECEAVSAEYRKGGAQAGERKPRVLVLKYPSADAALGAARSFEQAYLAKPKRALAVSDWPGAQAKTYEIEDGWLAFGRSGALLVMAVDCPDDATARMFLNQTATLAIKRGNNKPESGK